MTAAWLDLLWLVFLLALGSWLAAASCVPLLAHWLDARQSAPAIRCRHLVLTAAFPWLIPAVVVAAVLLTAYAKLVGWIHDHCPHHPGLAHPHLCFAHLPAVELGIVHAGVVSVVVALLVLGAVRLVRSQRRAHRELASLAALTGSRRRLRILPTRVPLALAGGVARPLVLMSRGLLDQLSFRERRIVAAHEGAHLRHGDARRNVLFEVLLLAHLPWTRSRLRKAWVGSLEALADDAVARRFGAEDVVETLLHVARINLRAAAPAFSMAGADVAGRARRLLDRDTDGIRRWPVFGTGYGLVVTGVFLVAVMDHHLLESLLATVVGR